jgi:hypothetical protein
MVSPPLVVTSIVPAARRSGVGRADKSSTDVNAARLPQKGEICNLGDDRAALGDEHREDEQGRESGQREAHMALLSAAFRGLLGKARGAEAALAPHPAAEVLTPLPDEAARDRRCDRD